MGEKVPGKWRDETFLENGEGQMLVPQVLDRQELRAQAAEERL